MAWTPTSSTILSRAIATNLLTYFAANQVEALNWAYGGAGLKPIKAMTDATAGEPAYPAIAFVSDNDAVSYGNDILEAAYTVTYEFYIQNAIPATAIDQARKYAAAFVSMIANCPAASLETDTGCTGNTAILQGIETGFDPIKTNDSHTDFMQQFQIRATYTLNAGAY